MKFRVPLIALALLAAGSVASAQLDRRSRDEPEIVLDHGGRVGFCDMLRWDAKGEFLFAGGDDKAVTVWPLDPTGKSGPRLKTDRTDAKTLRWPSWREKAGGVKNFAVHPSGERVAVGGLGMIPAGVAVLSRTESSPSESVVEAYTWPREKGENFSSVTAVAYDAAGERVAFGTASFFGVQIHRLPSAVPEPETVRVPARVWAAPVRAGKHTLPKGADAKTLPTRSRLVFFRDANTLVSVSMSGEVAACDLTGKMTDAAGVAPPAVKAVFHLNDTAHPDRRVYRAELTPDGKGLCVAFMGPSVGVYDLAGKGTDIDLGKDCMARSIAVEPGTGRVAVAVGGAKPADGNKPRFYTERANAVWVYEGGKRAAELPTGGRADAVAFHPTRKGLLAAAGGDADEVRLFDLDGKTPAEAVHTVRGAGRKAFAVGIGGGTQVAVKVASNPDATHPNDEAAGEWVAFDLSRQRAIDLPKNLSTARDEADGWAVSPDDDPDPTKRRRERWYAVGPAGKVELVFDRRLYNDPTCYTLVPKTDATPTRLLVGHAHGCSLFDLPAANGPGKLEPVAVYVGHTTEVLSVAASKDGTWFVSGGADHTVAAFSLTPWAGHPTLGAAFEVPDGKDELTVKSVAAGSPAWEAGLKAGERVDRVVLDGDDIVFNRVIDDRLTVRAGTPAAALAALARPKPPGRDVYLEVASPVDDAARLAVAQPLSAVAGGPVAVQPPARIRKTTVQQRPVWKWFAGFADAGKAAPKVTDSVVWMWKGSWYFAGTPNGDDLLGWHVNPAEVIGSPRFHRLQDLAPKYLKEELVRELLRTRDLSAALAAAQPLRFGLIEPELVKLVVQNPTVKAGEQVRVKVAVDRKGSDPDLLPDRVELWVNDYRKAVWRVERGKAFSTEAVIDAGELRAGDNSVTVMTRNPTGGRARDADVVVNRTPPPDNPRLVGWVGGVNEYAGLAAKPPANGRDAFAGLKKLDYAVPDATAVSTRFNDYTGRGKWEYFRDSRLKLKTDKEVGRGPLLKELDDLAELTKKGELKPDDTLVIFLAGHGVLIGDPKEGAAAGKTVAIPLDARRPEAEYANIRFAFCGIDFDPADPKGTGVPAEVLFDKLVALNCRKLVFLDVCHAGGVTDVDVVRQLLPHNQGPFVFAACGQGELSQEDGKAGHGLFTRSLLDATGDDFRRADQDADNALSCEELAAYCTGRVQELRVKMLKAKDPTAEHSDQNPVSSLRRDDPLRHAVVVRRAAK
jgi:WD40 repeat protein